MDKEWKRVTVGLIAVIVLLALFFIFGLRSSPGVVTLGSNKAFVPDGEELVLMAKSFYTFRIEDGKVTGYGFLYYSEANITAGCADLWFGLIYKLTVCPVKGGATVEWPFLVFKR